MSALAGRRALITGASGGIGAAIARALHGAGAELVLSYGSHREDAEAVASEVGAELIRADLSAPGAGRDLVERARSVDILVPNAGLGVQRPWDEVDDDLWAQTFAVNATAPWQMARAALPGMIERGFGRILFLSSVAAINGGVVGPHYAASKAALHGLTHHLAPRVAEHGVTVNAIAPALIANTRMLPGDGKAPPMPIPVGRFGEPEEIAELALSMLTNGYLTNKVITVDGGLVPR